MEGEGHRMRVYAEFAREDVDVLSLHELVKGRHRCDNTHVLEVMLMTGDWPEEL